MTAAPIVGTTTVDHVRHCPIPRSSTPPTRSTSASPGPAAPRRSPGPSPVSDGTDSCTDPTPTGGAAATVTYSVLPDLHDDRRQDAHGVVPGHPAVQRQLRHGGSHRHRRPPDDHVPGPGRRPPRPGRPDARPRPRRPACPSPTRPSRPPARSRAAASSRCCTPAPASIDANQAGNANYNAGAPGQPGLHDRQGQPDDHVRRHSPTRPSADPPFTVSATATSGLTVAFASNTLAVCTVSGTTRDAAGDRHLLDHREPGRRRRLECRGSDRHADLHGHGRSARGDDHRRHADLPDPSTVNAPYTVDVSVTRASGSSTITGTVTVSDGTDSCTDTTPTGGDAATVTYSCALTSTTTGAKTLTASFPANVPVQRQLRHRGPHRQGHPDDHLPGTRRCPVRPGRSRDGRDRLVRPRRHLLDRLDGLLRDERWRDHPRSSVGHLHHRRRTRPATRPTPRPPHRSAEASPIAKGDQTITFAALGGKVMFDAPFAISATATSGLTGRLRLELAGCLHRGRDDRDPASARAPARSPPARPATRTGMRRHRPSRERSPVSQATSSTVVTCPASVVYDGTAQTPCTVSVTGAGGLNLSPTPIYTLNTNVGTATADYTFAGDANHTGSSDSTPSTSPRPRPPRS